MLHAPWTVIGSNSCQISIGMQPMDHVGPGQITAYLGVFNA